MKLNSSITKQHPPIYSNPLMKPATSGGAGPGPSKLTPRSNSEKFSIQHSELSIFLPPIIVHNLIAYPPLTIIQGATVLAHRRVGLPAAPRIGTLYAYGIVPLGRVRHLMESNHYA